MPVEDLKELLQKYDKLRSLANSGSADKDLTLRFKILQKISEYKLLKNFSNITYTVPFASNRIRNEVLYTLGTITNLHKMNYLRTERTDKSSKEAIDVIKIYLEDIKRGPTFIEKLENNSWNIIGTGIGMISLLISMWPSTAQNAPPSPDWLIILKIIFLLIGAGLLIPFACGYLAYRIFSFFVERTWYKKWMKKLAIEDLRDNIINELIKLNNKTYTDLDRKYK